MSQKIPTRLPASVRALQFVTSMWEFHAIRAAVRYDLAGCLQHGPQTVSTLAEQTKTHALSLFRLLRALASIGVFNYENPEEPHYLAARFGHSEFSKGLVSDTADSVIPLFQLFTTEWQQESWRQLEHCLATGKPGLFLLSKQTPWEYIQHHPEELEPFQQGMTWFRQQVDPALLAAYPDFERCQHVVDVAGGNGTFLTHLLQAYEHLTGTLFDVPAVIELARASRMHAPEVMKRMQLVAGDFFAGDTIPTGGDCYCLGQILQDWDDQQCIQILRNVRAAMAPSGRVLIMEPVIFPEQSNAYSAFFDVQMMVALEGRTRTPREHAQLFEATHLTLSRVIPTSSIYSIVEGVPVL